MAGLFEQFATDKKAELEGVEVSFGTVNEDGSQVSFRIARMGESNKRYKAMMERETKPHATAIRNETLSPEIDKEITLKVFCHTVLIGWRNMIVPQLFESDEAVPYSPEAAEKLMGALPELYHRLLSEARKHTNFSAVEVRADSKN